MSFWTTRLSETPPTTPEKAPPVPAQVQGAWFSNPQLLGQQSPTVTPPAEAEITAPSGKSPKNLASRNAGMCPSCGGEYYGRSGPGNTYERCFSCGFNSRFAQAMQGAGSTTGSEGPAAPARQVASGGGGGSINNFHPDKGTF